MKPGPASAFGRKQPVDAEREIDRHRQRHDHPDEQQDDRGRDHQAGSGAGGLRGHESLRFGCGDWFSGGRHGAGAERSPASWEMRGKAEARSAGDRAVRLLLDVAGRGHFLDRQSLSFGQGIINRLLTGQSGREDFANRGCQTGKLGDRDELHADIGHRLDGRVGRVSRVDRCRSSSWRTAGLHIPGWHTARCGFPEEHCAQPSLDATRAMIVLVGRPVDERLGGVLGVRRRRDGQRPCPEPVGALAKTHVGGQSKADLVGKLGLRRIGQTHRPKRWRPCAWRTCPAATASGFRCSRCSTRRAGRIWSACST